ncbi:hypothetical protein [Nocardioides sp. CFH 31398]|uniref:hypothetical protein n=1 Tax=Nocardioides sp. CFH 31398 TaxID=2919579 RepID=UPI001F061728|nr:hypothetical protein [Nocardioides sp. CFH 31398]MCH1867090.1 hypothetical protein [Nocardioides sp. CFH 31398]
MDWAVPVSIKGPHKRIKITNQDEWWTMKEFRWKGWGSPRAVGRGLVKYGNANGNGRFHRATLVLSKRTSFDCADGASGSDPHNTYRQSKMIGRWGWGPTVRGGMTIRIKRGFVRC